MRFFTPQGRHVAPMGVKFGMEEEFHPHQCNDKRVGPQNWNFYCNLNKMWNINAPQGRIPWAIFTKFAQFVPHFRMRKLLKFGWICLRGCGVIGVLSWEGQVTPIFSAPPSGESMRQTPKSIGDARTCSRSSITMPSLVGLGFHAPLGRPKTLSFFVCLSVRHAFEHQSLWAWFRHEGVGVQKRFWYRWIGKGL